MGNNHLIISVAEGDTRVAMVEDGRLAEVYLERHPQADPRGNIFKGRVLKVIPGMAAAFVDIGLERPGYLFVEEAGGLQDDFSHLWLTAEDVAEPDAAARSLPPAPIEDLLYVGQEILVQVSRPASGGKGARLTTHISLPGYYLVYTPYLAHSGVSRRIGEEGERQRLKTLLADLKPLEGGLIARTAAQGQGREALTRERDFLLGLWKKILRKNEKASAPALLHQELEVARRVVRDLLIQEVDRLVVDDGATYELLLNYLEDLNPRLKHRLEWYAGPEPLFSHFGLELDWQRLLARRVWLKSGGYLLIETTEALTAIDVNTGKFVGRSHLEETLLKTNLEAAREIARQVRLRNIGGLIVIDFIDMEKPAHREQVHQTLVEALKKDRARSTILPMSSLGLVEMTRQRLRDSLAQMATEACACCGGRGRVLSPWTLAQDLMRQLAAEAREFPGCRLVVRAHPEVIAILNANGGHLWERLRQEHRVSFSFVEETKAPRDYVEISREWRPAGQERG